MVDIMCTGLQNNGHTPLPIDKIQMYFNVATRVDKDFKAANRGRRGTPSRNIHLAKILGEDIEENVVDDSPQEINAHEVLPNGDGNVEEEIVFATFMRGVKMNKATWDSLSPEARRIWDQLQQRDKDIILRSRPGMSPCNTRSAPQGSPSAEQPSPPPSALRSPSNR